MTFNKKEYISNYKKEHYSKLSVDLPKDVKDELIQLCSKKGITIKQFVLDAMSRLKKSK